MCYSAICACKTHRKLFVSRRNAQNITPPTYTQNANMHTHMQTHEVCKNDNIIIFRRETQKHFFIRAVAKHKKGRNSRNNFFKNIVMVRKKKTLLSTFAIVSLNHDKCYFEYLIEYFVSLIHTFNEIQSSINITMILLK